VQVNGVTSADTDAVDKTASSDLTPAAVNSISADKQQITVSDDKV